MKESFFSQHGGPFIIAEMSGNHNGSLETALEMVSVWPVISTMTSPRAAEHWMMA